MRMTRNADHPEEQANDKYTVTVEEQPLQRLMDAISVWVQRALMTDVDGRSHLHVTSSFARYLVSTRSLEQLAYK